MIPGRTVAPPRSRVSAAFPNNVFASAVEPTHSIRPSLIATASAEGCLGFIVMMRAFSKSKSGFAGVCVNAEGIGANKAVTRMSKQIPFTSVPPTARARVNAVRRV